MPRQNYILRSIPLRWTTLLALSAVLISSLGCVDPCRPKESFAEMQAKEIEWGKKTYHDNGCSRCHSINGAGGNVGPDLTHVGKKRYANSHEAATDENWNWFYKQISDPKSHHSSSHMPAYKGKIDDDSLCFLINYLGSLK